MRLLEERGWRAMVIDRCELLGKKALPGLKSPSGFANGCKAEAYVTKKDGNA